MERLLWRLEGGGVGGDPEALAAGLRLHIQHTPLTSVLVQAQGRQVAYLSCAACSGCREGRHTPACYLPLLQRLLRATLGQELVPTGGLAPQTYNQVLLAWPTPTSVMLTGEALAPWPQAHLRMHWRQRGPNLTAAALLAVSAGPDPRQALSERGWASRPLPPWLGQALTQQAIPGGLWPTCGWGGPPSLLFIPQDAVATES